MKHFQDQNMQTESTKYEWKFFFWISEKKQYHHWHRKKNIWGSKEIPGPDESKTIEWIGRVLATCPISNIISLYHSLDRQRTPWLCIPSFYLSLFRLNFLSCLYPESNLSIRHIAPMCPDYLSIFAFGFTIFLSFSVDLLWTMVRKQRLFWF